MITHNGITYEKNGRKWRYRLLEPYHLDLPDRFRAMTIHHPFGIIANGELVVKRFYAWNGANWPAWNTKTIIRGSLIHDLCYQLIREGYMAGYYRKDADMLFRDICLEDGMWPFRAWYAYRSVRTFGWLHTRRKK